jgi:type IV secretion system protein VirB10
MVAVRRQDRSAWWFAGGALIATVLLFSALEARRQGGEQAKDQATASTSFAAPEAIPELVVPTSPAEPSRALIGPDGWPEPGSQQQRTATPVIQPQSRPQVSRSTYQPQPTYADSSYQAPPAPYPNGPGASGPAFETPPAPIGGAAASGSSRVMAGRLENLSTTVIQGTLINAVLETALDSTRPGQTRAVVTRDVYGFDGKRLLIPRGTRLYGSYEADVAQGQQRAQIHWTRLLRPDGVSVALDSPAADPLGRAGVAGKVNNHFFQRLGNALLGTTANLGSALVTRSIAPSSPVVVAVPGATQSVSQSVTPSSTQIVPTLTVRQGTRITVFVQHDLDFTSVDEAP